MSLTQLNAQQLARIDAICIEFEDRLRQRLIARQAAAASALKYPQVTDHSQATELTSAFASVPDLQQDIDAEVESLVVEYERENATRQMTLEATNEGHAANVDTLALEVQLLRQELNAVAEEMLNSPPAQTARRSGERFTAALGEQNTSGKTPDSVSGSLVDSESQRGASGWLEPGMQIGPYLIQQRIGRGGMGEVYRGLDVRLGREVAIKVLVQSWSDNPEHADRFDREARAVATLSHPNIVSLYDVGQHSGRPYAVMELLKGETLRDRIKRDAPLSPTEVRTIGIEAAEALEVAHQAGIIHRDLKPENLFITTDDRIKLLDFGLSRSLQDAPGGSDPTVTGVILGTMGYLSPEQADGGRITPAADLFSLGCVLHECFYGNRPFRGETPSESIASTLTSAPNSDPKRAEVDPQLADIISRCLEKSPSKRPQDAGELARLLSSEDATAKLQSDLATATDRLAVEQRRTSRRGWFVAAGTVAAASVAAGMFLRLRGTGRWSSEIRSIAVLPLSDSGPPGRTADGLELRTLAEGEQLAAAIADQLTRVPELRVLPFLPLREYELLGGNTKTATRSVQSWSVDSLKAISQQLGVDALLIGTVKVDRDGYRTIEVKVVEGRTGYQIARDWVRFKAQESLIAQEETAKKVAARIGGELIEYRKGRTLENGTYHCLVNGYSRMDSESVEALRDAMKCFKNAISQDEKFAEAYSGLALTSMLLVAQVEFEERAELIPGARDAFRAAIDLGDGDGLARLAESMVAWQVDWDFDRAEQLFDQIVPRMPDSWIATHEYSLFLAARGDLDKAIELANRSISLDPTSTAFRVDAARLRWFAGDAETALAELGATASRAEGRRLDYVHGAMLDVLEGTGRWDEAQELVLGKRQSFSTESYWPMREAKVVQQPYGPFDQELNRLILRVRRQDQLNDQDLSKIEQHRPPRLPFLLSAHPALAPYRMSRIFEKANCLRFG